jgi:hypothetical protein
MMFTSRVKEDLMASTSFSKDFALFLLVHHDKRAID